MPTLSMLRAKDGLDDVMRNKIFPLLQEYFYDDWEKIRDGIG
jgi:5-methylcytosine-specific restriction enzyme B